jgi:acetolactate synthase-1/2/3 large subunit
MTKLTGGQAVVKTLEAEGAEVAYGILGSHCMPTFDALADSSIRLIVPRCEDAAGHMADAYTRVSNNPGVVLTTVGPGACGVSNAMGEAYNESWPMMHVSTQIMTQYMGQEKGMYHDGPNQKDMFKPVSSWQHTVTSAGEIPEAINEGYRRMRTGRPRPVFIEIPSDVLINEDDIKILPRANVTPPPIKDSELKDSLNLIINAKRPLLWFGGGTVKANAMAEVKQLAEMLQAPVLCTNGSKGVLSEDHPLALGNLLTISDTLQNELLAKADVVLGVGIRFSQRATKQWTVPMPETVIHADIDKAEFGKNYKAKVTVEGDAKVFLQSLLTALEKKGFKAEKNRCDEISALKIKAIEELKKKQPAVFDILLEIRDMLPRDAIVASQSIMGHWTRFGFECYQPGSFLFANTFGCMGFAFHAAVGAKAAFPDRKIIAFCGDGGFTYGSGELATLQQYNLAMPIIIFNNGGYSIIRQRQDAKYGRNIGTVLTNPDYVQLAKAYGFKGIKINNPDELAPAIRKALNDNTTWIIEVPFEFEGYRTPAETEMLMTGKASTDSWKKQSYETK